MRWTGWDDPAARPRRHRHTGQRLVEAVRAAASGDALISPALTVRLLQRRPRRRGPDDARPGPAVPLSERELEGVRLVARGHTNAEICGALFLSLGTVKSHLGSAQTKLRLTNRVQLAAWAWEHQQVR